MCPANCRLLAKETKDEVTIVYYGKDVLISVLKKKSVFSLIDGQG